MEERLLRLPDVVSRIGLKRASIYRAIAAGELEGPIRISQRSVAWRESAIRDFIARKIAAAGRDPHGFRNSETGEPLVRA